MRPTLLALLPAAALLLPAAPASAGCVDGGAGQIECSGADVVGVDDGRDAVWLDVLPGATIDVPTGDAVRLGGADAFVTNEGAIRAGGAGVVAGAGAIVSNEAGATIVAGGDGLRAGEDADVLNRGTIRSTGPNGNGIAVASGLVGNEAGALVEARAATGAAIAVGRGSGETMIDNLGTVRGGAGIRVDPADGREQVVLNGAGGVIEGTGGVAVDLGAGDDELVNRGGEVRGDVILGAGDDIYEIADGGRQHGDVVLGAGDDEFLFLGGGTLLGDVLFGDGDDLAVLAGFEDAGVEGFAFASDAILDGGEGEDGLFLGIVLGEITFRRGLDGVLGLLLAPPALTPFAFRVANFETLFVLSDDGSGYADPIAFADIVAPVPLPAGGWMVLAALGGLGAMRAARRRAA